MLVLAKAPVYSLGHCKKGVTVRSDGPVLSGIRLNSELVTQTRTELKRGSDAGLLDRGSEIVKVKRLMCKA
eukprot:3473586-Rhodomonas_salina.3